METDVETPAPTRTVEKVVVLGAGPAGLAAGHEISAGGVRVVVLERAPWVGGLSMTWEHRRFRFDIGGHRWFTKKQWLQSWFLKLMEGELVTVNRISRIYFGGKYFDYPVRVGNVLRTAGVFTSIHAVLSSIFSQVKRAFRPEKPENIEQAYIAQFGPKLYQMFFKRYTEKVWGRDCRELSADWVSQRTKGLSIWETGKNAILKPRQKVESLVDQFVYPRLGYQRICERMAEDIEACGGEVRLESTVVGVEVEPDGVVVRYRDRKSGEVREERADHVVSTIPLGRLVEILRPEAPSTVIDAAKGLEFRSVVTANICLDREQVTPDTWLYIHEPGIGFARIHEPKNWSRAMVPEGKTSVCAEWFCTVGDEVWELSDEEIVERTVAHLADDLGFIDRSEVIDGFCLRARQAYPVYTLDYGRRVDTLKRHLRNHEDRISICGRGGTFRYNNADHSVEMGLLVGMNLLGATHDVDAVNTEDEYHEEKRVERG